MKKKVPSLKELKADSGILAYCNLITGWPVDDFEHTESVEIALRDRFDGDALRLKEEAYWYIAEGCGVKG